MQISSTRDPNLFYVDWWLMNHNSRRASYEHELLHCGNIDLPYLKDCRRFIDQSSLFASKNNKKVSVSFTGGEVTEWADFDDLIKYAKGQDCQTRFTTNANLELDRFEQILNHTDSVIIEIHPEFTSAGRTLFFLSKITDLKVNITVNINMLPESWKDMMDLNDKIIERYPTININKKMLFDDPIFNTTPQNYSEEQIIALKSQWGDIKIEKNGDIEYTNFQTLILEKRNRFHSFKCYAGIEQIIVDAWGAVYRGHCRKNGFMGYLKDPELYWYSDPMICRLESCVNHFDLQATKSLE